MTHVQATPAWVSRWAAGVLPLAGALVCLIYALLPGLFPAEMGFWIALAAVVELPMMFLGVVHAVALREGELAERFYVFGIGLAVLALGGGAHFAWELSVGEFGPMLAWVVAGISVDLCVNRDEPQLAYDRAWAVLMDRATLLELVPYVVAGTVLLGMGGHLTSLMLGYGGLDAATTALVQRFQPSWLALLPALYLGVVSACTLHVYGDGFREHRRRLLDFAWLRRVRRLVGGKP